MDKIGKLFYINNLEEDNFLEGCRGFPISGIERVDGDIKNNQKIQLEILKTVIQRDYQFALICQDNVVFKSEFTIYLKNIINFFPEDAVLVNIGCYSKDLTAYDLTKNRAEDSIYIGDKIYNNYICTPNQDLPTPNLAYIVSKKGAETLIDFFGNTEFTEDNNSHFNDYCSKKNILYYSIPVLCTIDNEDYIKYTNYDYTNVYTELINGLGDKLTDMVGFKTLCDFLKLRPNVIFNNNVHWGEYDLSLFQAFDNINITSKKCNLHINRPDPITSLLIYKIYEYVNKKVTNISFKDICKIYVDNFRNTIKPSKVITDNLPDTLRGAYGIHLRKSDKLVNYLSTSGDTIDTLSLRIEFLLKDIEELVAKEKELTLFLCSEDDNWKKEIESKIKNISNNIKFIHLDYSLETNYKNYKSILDLFALSMCKSIFQIINSSSFSCLAALLGNRHIISYNSRISEEFSILEFYEPLLRINNKVEQYDIEAYKFLSNNFLDFKPNF